MTNIVPNGTKGMGRVPGVMASTTEQSSYSETYIRKDPTDVGFKNACWTFFGLIHVTTDVITIVPSQERRSLLRLHTVRELGASFAVAHLCGKVSIEQTL